MIKFLKKFRTEEDGAVTVDWVVLTAAVVGLAIAAFTAIEDDTGSLINAAGTALGAQNAESTF
jgi:Flp pilus assembly pilin Flp